MIHNDDSTFAGPDSLPPIDNNAKLTTDLEKKLFEWLWLSQQYIAKDILNKVNKDLERDGRQDCWPAMQEWDDLAGSSQAIFLSKARFECSIPNDDYLNILRTDDAQNIIEKYLD